MNEQFLKRLKSFVWRLGGYLLVLGLTWIADHFGELGLPAYLTTIIGLVVGEITKYLNTGKK